MSRLRYFISRFAAASLAVLWVASGGGVAAASDVPASPTNPPNIVMIIGDDQAWSDYGFMGHPQIQTPNLDRLAARGALFKRGYVPTALCRPSLATMITGLYAHQHLLTGNDPSPKLADEKSREYANLRQRMIDRMDENSTLPGWLRQRGYVSFQSGKWWEGSFANGGFTHGMTRGFPHPGGRHGDDGLSIGRQGLQPVFDFIDQSLASQQPFFVWYAPLLPHTPHNPPHRLFDKYAATVDSPHVARYYAMCEWFDETVGQLIEHLEQHQAMQNTLLVYVCDNGWKQNPDSPGFAARSKQTAYEGGVRQPLIVCWEGTIPPRQYDDLVSSIDIAPTILSAVGISPATDLPGESLLNLVRDAQPLERQQLFGEGFTHDVADLESPEASLIYRWTIRGPWKLIITYDVELDRHSAAHQPLQPQPQLFDLQADPHEQRNLAAEQPELLKQLSQDIARWWPLKARKPYP
ncbi:MAG: sulfatase-like hydrolase/transferase [Pirellulaceae bacterium]|nr:sulfatase-like hydrolase/transferase [Pirellulaceae bacterium]